MSDAAGWATALLGGLVVAVLVLAILYILSRGIE